jgi:hypothetical protein
MNLSVVEDWLRLRFVVGSSVSRASSPKRSTSHQTTVDGLLRAIAVSDVDRILSPLQPVITICKLLQIVTTTFDASRIQNYSDSILLATLSDTIQIEKFYHAQTFFNDANCNKIEWEPLLRILYANYRYEKDEPSISPRLLGLLKDKVRESTQTPITPVVHANNKPDDLMSFDAPVVKQPPKRSMLVDSTAYLSFQMQSSQAMDEKSTTVNTADWGDKNEQESTKRRIEISDRWQRDEDRLWARVRVEIPEWVMKQMDSITGGKT